MIEAKLYIFLLASDDLNFRIDRPQGIIILENLNWLYAARDKAWSNFKLFQYLHWVKETLDTQSYVKSEQVFTQIGDFYCLLTVNILGHL